jgi:hypothetical protein
MLRRPSLHSPIITACLFARLETLRRWAKESHDVALHVISTVQEKIGSRGAASAAYAINPDVGIVIDVVNATDDSAPAGEPGGNDSKPIRVARGGVATMAVAPALGGAAIFVATSFSSGLLARWRILPPRNQRPNPLPFPRFRFRV